MGQRPTKMQARTIHRSEILIQATALYKFVGKKGKGEGDESTEITKRILRKRVKRVKPRIKLKIH
jgi:hypothetical protein